MFGYIYRLIIIPGIITIGYFYGHLLLANPGPEPVNLEMPQRLLQSHALLLNSNGTPEEFGYSTAPFKVFNEDSLLPWQKMRVKKWDHFDVITDEFIITISVVDALFIGEVRLDYFDFTTREQKSLKKQILPHKIPTLSYTTYRFTGESKADDVYVDTGDIVLKIENIGTAESPKYNSRRISLTSQELNLNLDFSLREPIKQEMMAAVIPLAEEKQHFFSTIKMPNLPSEGSLRIGSKTHEIKQDKASGFIDWGRGVWPYNSYWVFARAQGFIEGNKRFSLVFASGYGNNQTNAATEDSFFIDEILYKLNYVEPKFDDHNLMNPWSFKTKLGSQKENRECEITFVPHSVSQKSFNIFFLKSDMRVTFGEFNGWVTDKDNKKYTFEKLYGMVEVHKAKW